VFSFIRNKLLKTISIILLSAVIVISLCFIFYKPLHAVSPKIYGMSKIGPTLYIDNIDKRNDALLQYNNSIEELYSIGFKYERYPKIIFCYDHKSYERFGFKQSAARSIEGIAIILGPRGITETYFLKHELIHYWQEKYLGIFYNLNYPKWVIEGMAYSISNDIRHPLEEPWEDYRNKFEEWYNSIDKNNLIFEIKKSFYKKK
jgi:hypothetical protein